MPRSSKNIEKKFFTAEELTKQLRTQEAFEIYKTIAENPRCSFRERANAYANMGQLVECWDPSLAPEDDESGLAYYQHALLLDGNNFDALHGITRSFGETFPYHQDVIAFELAYDHLRRRHKLLLDRYNLWPFLREKHALMVSMEKLSRQ